MTPRGVSTLASARVLFFYGFSYMFPFFWDLQGIPRLFNTDLFTKMSLMKQDRDDWDGLGLSVQKLQIPLCVYHQQLNRIV